MVARFDRTRFSFIASIITKYFVSEVSSVKCRLLESEFEHAFKVVGTQKEQIVAQLTLLLKAQKHAKLATAFISRYAPAGTVTPKGLADRAKLIVEVLSAQ